MSLQFTRYEFVECPTCAAKSGSPSLCRECLERREMHAVVGMIRNKGTVSAETLFKWLTVCPHCAGVPHPRCPEHGR